MNKRKAIVDTEFNMLPDAKHCKIDNGNYSELLNDIQFMDFDDEFTTSEESIDDKQQSSNDLASSCIEFDNQSHGIDNNNLQKNTFLDLSTWKRCTVDNCERDVRTGDLIISGYEDPIENSNPMSKLNDADGNAPAKKLMQCRLQQFWSQCRMAAGDTISIMGAVWNVKLQSYCVTNADGLVVVRPDFLVSGTTVVGGLFCMRKAVLQDRFKGIETGMKIVSIFISSFVCKGCFFRSIRTLK